MAAPATLATTKQQALLNQLGTGGPTGDAIRLGDPANPPGVAKPATGSAPPVDPIPFDAPNQPPTPTAPLGTGVPLGDPSVPPPPTVPLPAPLGGPSQQPPTTLLPIPGTQTNAQSEGFAPGEDAPNTQPPPAVTPPPAVPTPTTPADAPPAAPPPTATPTVTRKYAPIQGFDTGKLDGTTPYDSKDKYSDAVRSFSAYLGGGGSVGRGNLEGAVAAARADGFKNAKVVGDDKIDFGDGNGPIDVINSKGEVWFQNGADRFGGGQAGAPDAGGLPAAGGGLPSGGGIPAPAPSGGGDSPSGGGGLSDALSKRIAELLGQDITNVDLNAPGIKSQLDVRTRANQRAAERARSMAAERRATGGFGTSGGAFDSDLERLNQAQGEADASAGSDLVTNELANRRELLQAGIATETGRESQDKQIALQDRLAQLDAALRGRGLDLQGRGLDIQQLLGERGLDLQGRGLAQDDQHFNDTLGFNIGRGQADDYWRRILAGLGGA